MEFGRMVVARKKGNGFQFVDVNDPSGRRARARRLESQNDIEGLFG